MLLHIMGLENLSGGVGSRDKVQAGALFIWAPRRILDDDILLLGAFRKVWASSRDAGLQVLLRCCYTGDG